MRWELIELQRVRENGRECHDLVNTVEERRFSAASASEIDSASAPVVVFLAACLGRSPPD